jgi:NAD dependent epimerase/dehydratase
MRRSDGGATHREGVLALMSPSPILVTGAGGFIGSHLVEGLLRRGERVRAFLRYNSAARRGWLDEVPDELRGGLEVFFGDITDAGAVRQAATGCSRIFHLAALIGIPYSYVAPISYVTVNVTGTLNVLEAAKALGTERIIVTSTSEVYGTAQYTPIDEAHPLQAQSPYSATKIGADHLSLSYFRSFALPVTVVRPFNTYGPRQSTRAVVPTIITQALAAKEVRLGSLDPVRDLVFVEDTVAGFIAAADSPACVGQVTNLAGGVGVTVGELVETIFRLTGRTLPVVETEERKRPEASEVFKLIGSAAKAKERAGWTARTSLEAGLTKTLNWFREQPTNTTVGEYRI